MYQKHQKHVSELICSSIHYFSKHQKHQKHGSRSFGHSAIWSFGHHASRVISAVLIKALRAVRRASVLADAPFGSLLLWLLLASGFFEQFRHHFFGFSLDSSGILHNFGPTSTTLGHLWELLLPPWVHFWNTSAAVFESKNTGALEGPQEAPTWDRRI